MGTLLFRLGIDSEHTMNLPQLSLHVASMYDHRFSFVRVSLLLFEIDQGLLRECYFVMSHDFLSIFCIFQRRHFGIN